MQKIEASKLLTKILFEGINTNFVVILSDEPIFQKCVEDTLTKKNQKRPKVFDGVQTLTQYNQYVRQNDLFEPLSDSIILLEENFTTKKGNAETIKSHGNTVFVFGKTILRHAITGTYFPEALVYLCYSPQSGERQRCVEILAGRHPFVKPNSTRELANIAEHALLCYNNNLYDCDLHFERMEKGRLNFANAQISETSMSSFDIVRTLLEGNSALLDMRLQQYAMSGEDVSQIFRAIVYVFKQVAHVHAELAKTSNIHTAILNAKIPYPAQDNIKKAIQNIPYAKIEQFFAICAQLELSLRECKNPYQILFLELSAFHRNT